MAPGHGPDRSRKSSSEYDPGSHSQQAGGLCMSPGWNSFVSHLLPYEFKEGLAKDLASKAVLAGARAFRRTFQFLCCQLPVRWVLQSHHKPRPQGTHTSNTRAHGDKRKHVRTTQPHRTHIPLNRRALRPLLWPRLQASEFELPWRSFEGPDCAPGTAGA